MSESLNPMTYDLAGVLSGRDYPTLEVEVYFNEVLGFAITQARETLKSLTILGDEEGAAEIQEKLNELVESVAQSKYIFTLKGVPSRVLKNINRSVNKKYPARANMFGQVESNPEGDEMNTKLTWLAYIQSYTLPDGTVRPFSESDAETFYDEAPIPAQKALNAGIKKLQDGVNEGFEFAAKEVDFLSLASPEG